MTLLTDLFSQVHADENGNPCALCDLAFQSEDDLLEHFKEHREEELNRRRKALNRLQCETCGRRFNKESTMERHQCAVVAKSKVCINIHIVTLTSPRTWV